MVIVLLMLLAISFGVAAFGKRFRFYSIATVVILVAFGALTGLNGPRVAANLPTPWVGVWERINISVFLLWVAVLAITLLRGGRTQDVHVKWSLPVGASDRLRIQATRHISSVAARKQGGGVANG
jgi:hypothetical protein